jgi:hypothetical protein
MGLSMLDGDINQLLKTKLRDSFIMPKRYSKIAKISKPV